MVHESHATDLKGTKSMVVDQLSASPLLPDCTYFGIENTHSGMCKFDSKNSPGWTNVSVTLKSWIQEAEPAVQRYWSDEMMARRQKDESEMDKLKSKYQNQVSNAVSHKPWQATDMNRHPALPRNQPQVLQILLVCFRINSSNFLSHISFMDLQLRVEITILTSLSTRLKILMTWLVAENISRRCRNSNQICLNM
jgi:hypothetical protein